MSYSFEMSFRQCESFDEAMRVAIRFTKSCKDNYEEMLNLHKYYIPSHRSDKYDKEHDNYWLYDLFNIQFVWWQEWNLLAVIGTVYPKESMQQFPFTVYFQNSTDQDYDFDNWSDKITVFQKTKAAILQKSLEEIYQKYVIEKERDWIELEELNQNPEYYQKSLLYDEIFEKLDLNSWLYGRESSVYERITLNAIDSAETFFKMALTIKTM